MNNKNKSGISRREALKKIGIGTITSVAMTHIGVGGFAIEPLEAKSSRLLNGRKPILARIDTAYGAPRLLINGKPVRARMFFGVPFSKTVVARPEARFVSFEFIAAVDTQEGQLNFRFEKIPGDVYFDNIHVIDQNNKLGVLSSGDFEDGLNDFVVEYVPSDSNAVGDVSVEPGIGHDHSGGLHVRLSKPSSGAAWPDFFIHPKNGLSLVQDHRYQVSFWVRAEPEQKLTVSTTYLGNPCLLEDGTNDCYQSQIKLASEVGVDLVSFLINLPWRAPDKPLDFTTVDLQCQRVLNANPKALLLPRVRMDPPLWWFQVHPNEAMIWENGLKNQYKAVPGQVYRHDACQQLAVLISHLEEQFGDHIVGYHPVGQNTGEWFYQTWGSLLNGYSQGDQREWRDWLKRRYGNNEALRKSWGDCQVTFTEAEVPPASERHAAPVVVFRDPVTERRLIDFAEFQQELMADCVCDLAHAVRQATAGRKLVVFFFGYVFEFGSIKIGPTVSGHYGLRQVLECPDIDMLCSPISYFDRGLGGNGSSMTAAESVALAGKMWLYEDDTRTYLGTGDFAGYRDMVHTLIETKQLLVRNTSQCALRNFATWWMDLGATGWFNDPGMWTEMKRLEALDQSLLQNPLPYRPQVAAVIDPASLMLVAPGGFVASGPGVYNARKPLGRMGAPYGQYLLDDIMAGKVPARLYVMLAAWYLSPEQRRQLLAAIHGAVRVWCYAPGYLNPQGTSLKAMHELTGFRFRKVDLPIAMAQTTNMGKKLGLRDTYGVQEKVSPLFAVEDATDEEILATYSDGSAAIVMRHTSEGLSIFVGTPGLTSELLRVAAHRADVHLFTEVDCNVYANEPYLSIHTSQDGPLTINTGRSGRVQDMLSGESLGLGPRIVLPLKQGETRVLKYN